MKRNAWSMTCEKSDYRVDTSVEAPEEFSPEVERLLAALDVPVEILDFDFGTQVH